MFSCCYNSTFLDISESWWLRTFFSDMYRIILIITVEYHTFRLVTTCGLNCVEVTLPIINVEIVFPEWKTRALYSFFTDTIFSDLIIFNYPYISELSIFWLEYNIISYKMHLVFMFIRNIAIEIYIIFPSSTDRLCI